MADKIIGNLSNEYDENGDISASFQYNLQKKTWEELTVSGGVGVTGPTGPTGPQGLQGLDGIPGQKGDTGPQGIQGIQGPEGDKGEQGESGTSVTVIQASNDSEAISLSQQNPNNIYWVQ